MRVTAWTPANPDTVAQAILDGLGNLPITVTPVPRNCEPLSVEFSPPSRTVTSGDIATFEEWISVPNDDTLCGEVHCTVEFRSDEGQVIGTQEVWITILDVTEPELTCPPDIRVCNDRGLCSAVVEFAPEVSDNCSASNAIEVTCEPPSGSTFPVGRTTVTCTATDESGNQTQCSFDVTVVDCEPAVVACRETVNPHGKNVPPAGSTTLPGPKGGQNEDGFYELLALFDNCDNVEDIDLFVIDSGSGVVFGPFSTGDKIKYTEAPGGKPKIKKMGSSNGQAGAIAAHITGKGDAQVFGVDSSGNASEPEDCLVPPFPK